MCTQFYVGFQKCSKICSVTLTFASQLVFARYCHWCRNNDKEVIVNFLVTLANETFVLLIKKWLNFIKYKRHVNDAVFLLKITITLRLCRLFKMYDFGSLPLGNQNATSLHSDNSPFKFCSLCVDLC